MILISNNNMLADVINSQFSIHAGKNRRWLRWKKLSLIILQPSRNSRVSNMIEYNKLVSPMRRIQLTSCTAVRKPFLITYIQVHLIINYTHKSTLIHTRESQFKRVQLSLDDLTEQKLLPWVWLMNHLSERKWPSHHQDAGDHQMTTSVMTSCQVDDHSWGPAMAGGQCESRKRSIQIPKPVWGTVEPASHGHGQDGAR